MREIKPTKTVNDIILPKKAKSLLKNNRLQPKKKPVIAKKPSRKVEITSPKTVTSRRSSVKPKPIRKATSKPIKPSVAHKVLARKVTKPEPKVTSSDKAPQQSAKGAELDLNSLPGPDDLILDPKAAENVAKRTNRQRQKRLWLKRGLLILGAVILLLAGFLVYKTLIASNNLLQGGFGGFFNQSSLKTDAAGRTNVLLFGTSEDDPGHDGADLADSIMVVSVDKENKKMSMVSLPRDLWVELEEPCEVGYQAKINTVFMCGMGNNRNEERGAQHMINMASRVTGLEVQYYAKVNYTSVKQLVDAIGGVEVDIKSEDPRGIYDANMNFRLPNGKSTLDGQKALDLMRVRNSHGGYGLSRSNFDREQNQQLVLQAVLNKTLSAGILTDYGKLVKLIDTVGANVKTNFSTSEINSVINLAKTVDLDSLSSNRIDMVAQDKPLLKTAQISGASVVVPTAGTYDYSEIKRFLDKTLGGKASFTSEDAKIGVFNASGVEGAAGSLAEKLTTAGFDVTKTGNVTGGNQTTTTIYRLNDSKPLSLEKLKQETGASEVSGSPAVDTSGLDFAVIIGQTSN